MQKTAAIKLDLTQTQASALADVQRAYADACQHLVPLVVVNRCWNRVDLHRLAYADLRAATLLGAQMCPRRLERKSKHCAHRQGCRFVEGRRRPA